MFQKLHRQLTFFCAVITGAILVALSLVCLLFAQKAITQIPHFRKNWFLSLQACRARIIFPTNG